MNVPLSGWKTVIFAALVAFQGFLAGPEVQAFVTEHYAGASVGLAVVIAGLRAVTSSPMFKGDA